MNQRSKTNIQTLVITIGITMFLSGLLYLLVDSENERSLRITEGSIADCDEIPSKPDDFKPVDGTIQEKQAFCIDFYTNHYDKIRQAHKSFVTNQKIFLAIGVPLIISGLIISMLWITKKDWSDMNEGQQNMNSESRN